MLARKLLALAPALLLALVPGARAADPIKIGFAVAETGPLAGYSKQMKLTAQIWAEQVNKQGGLLGRPVELISYDDQSNPALDAGIYVKLLDVDKVDFVFSLGTADTVPVMPTVMEHKKLVIAGLALEVNNRFHYDRYFQTMPYGPDGKDSLTHGFFEAAMQMNPKPQTLALVGVDNEFSAGALQGGRNQAQRLGIKIVYDRTYPPTTVDFSPIVRSVNAANADLVLLSSYPGDTAGFMRSVSEQGLNAKLFGGPIVGLQSGTLKMQYGDMLNGIVCYELYVHEPTMNFPGIDKLVAEYQARAGAAGLDPLGYYVPPYSYINFDILGQAITATGSLDQDKLAQYIHATSFHTIVGDVKFGPDGEWAKSRILTIQYQNVQGHGLEQFTRAGTQVILDPPEFKTGTLQYPYRGMAKN